MGFLKTIIERSFSLHTFLSNPLPDTANPNCSAEKMVSSYLGCWNNPRCTSERQYVCTQEKISISSEPANKVSYVETHQDLSRSQYSATINSSFKKKNNPPPQMQATFSLFSDLPCTILEKSCWLTNFTSHSWKRILPSKLLAQWSQSVLDKGYF